MRLYGYTDARMARRLSGLAVIVLFAVMASPASAAVIHAPANGVTVQKGTPLLFDWAWDDDEYATQGIVFTQVANPSDPIWMWGPGEANTNPGRIVVSDRYGPFLDSNATINFDNAKFVPGTWYWRLCNKSIYGEDDKCGLDAEVRSLVLAPPAICNDGIDNDLDGDTDWVLDDGCGGDRNGATEGPLPQCADGLDNDGDGGLDLADRECKRRTDKLEAPDPLPRLFPGAAKAYVRSALRQEFGSAYRYGSFKRIRRCGRVSRTRMKCRRVSWGIGDVGYEGRVSIWLDNADNGDVWWFYSMRVKRTNWYCWDRKRQGDPAYKGKRCSKTYRVR